MSLKRKEERGAGLIFRPAVVHFSLCSGMSLERWGVALV